MSENVPENAAYDDLFGIDVDAEYVGEELSDEEVEAILNG